MEERQRMTRRLSAAGLLAVVSMLAAGPAATAQASDSAAPDALCTPAGVAARLGLGLDPQGRVSVPDPTQPGGLDEYWRAHNALATTIEMELARWNVEQDPVAAARRGAVSGPTLPPYWHVTVVGAGTQVSGLSCPMTGTALDGLCAASSVGSPLNRLEPFGDVGDVDGARFFWKVVSDAPEPGPQTYPALVYAEPTVHPCVSKFHLAVAPALVTCLDGWILHENQGEAFLIVNNCVSLYDATTGEPGSTDKQGQRGPRPSVGFMSAIHQSCPNASQCCEEAWKPCDPR